MCKTPNDPFDGLNCSKAKVALITCFKEWAHILRVVGSHQKVLSREDKGAKTSKKIGTIFGKYCKISLQVV